LGRRAGEGRGRNEEQAFHGNGLAWWELHVAGRPRTPLYTRVKPCRLRKMTAHGRQCYQKCEPPAGLGQPLRFAVHAFTEPHIRFPWRSGPFPAASMNAKSDRA
jgi:hypothetical protein